MGESPQRKETREQLNTRISSDHIDESSVSVSPFSFSDLDQDYQFSLSPDASDDSIRMHHLHSTNLIRSNSVCTSFAASKPIQKLVCPKFFSSIAQEELADIGLELLRTVETGLIANLAPVELEDGVSGAFLLRKLHGGYAGVFKPEETLSRRSSCIGVKTEDKNISPNKFRFSAEKQGMKLSETSVREVAAFLLDTGSFAHVPETIMVEILWRCFNPDQRYAIEQLSSRSKSRKCYTRSYSLHDEFNFDFDLDTNLLKTFSSLDVDDTNNFNFQMSNQWKVGSLQKFVDHDCDACDVSFSKFEVDQVHKLGVFDIRVMNTDRHEGNILLKLNKEGDYCSGFRAVVPIDHGFILPDFMQINLEGNFCWIHWPQSSVKFSPEIKEYVKSLDSNADCAKLIRLLGNKIAPSALISLKLGTELLKIGILEFDLTLKEIGMLIVGECESVLIGLEDKRKGSPLVRSILAAKAMFDSEVGLDNMKFIERFKKKLRAEIAQLKQKRKEVL